MPYTLYPVDIMKGQQREPEYVKLNPNARIPTIVDRDAGDFAVLEVRRDHDLPRREGRSPFTD